MAPLSSDLPSYDRDQWRHWVDEDDDCQDTRQEVLIAESNSAVEFTDADQCRVASGAWSGPYTGEEFDDPAELDIDHLVPLANAHASGGWAWSESRKRQYANDLTFEGHLVAVQSQANRTKGASGPEGWKPPHETYWCQYAIDWTTIKNSWGLTATEAEVAALTEMLDTCEPRRILETLEPEERPQVTATPEALAEGTYASCEEAEAAGEEREQGSAGEGWGFPQAVVPDARDGDSDGIVCEETVPSPATQRPAATATPVATPTADIPSKNGVGGVYASCEEAEAAGVEREKGSAGEGWGFPKAVVPDARDGDYDGVVCEQSSRGAPQTPEPSSPATPTPSPVATDTNALSDKDGVYASCDEAEAAGEERVQGSSGSGRGFPQSMVPDARDGDGDGVVCER